MEIQPHDWPGMTAIYVILVQASLCSSAICSVGLVYVSFLSTNPESRRFIVREVECCDCNFSSFVVPGMLEFQSFLVDQR
jgi:hypothetical protein